MKMKLPLILASSVLCAGCCGKCPAPAKAEPTPTYQLPTAAEVFRLRSECARLGEKILEDNAIGPMLNQLQVSNYNARTNRCYVELTVMSNGDTVPPQSHSTLYDGQTRELLASIKSSGPNVSGMVYKRGENSAPGSDSGFSSASDLINRLMTEE